MDAVETVNRFLHAYWQQDHEHTLSLVTDDVLWLNVPLPKLRIEGREMMRMVLTAPNMGYPAPVEEGHHVAGLAMAQDDQVMMERVDRIRMHGTWIEVPVNGVFRLRDGKIATWKDYYDSDGYVRQLAAIGVHVDFSEWV